MLDQFYYESSDQKSRIDIGKDGIYVYSNNVRDYDWSYTEEGSKLNFKKSLGKKKLPLLFAEADYKACSKRRDEVFCVFERDVKLGRKGRLWINGYYMECYITGSTNKGIIRTRFLETTFDIVTDGVWHKETLHRFYKTAQEVTDDSTGLDMPYDYEYDLGYTAASNRQVIDNKCIVNSGFILTIYGRATDPLIEINGHKYMVNGTITGTERLVITNIDSEKHSIRKYAADETFADWFGRRYKNESIFEKIPEGNVEIFWDGTFGFDLTLIDDRSEPVWYVDSGEDEPVNPPVDDEHFLVDSNSDYILDSNGENVEVA